MNGKTGADIMEYTVDTLDKTAAALKGRGFEVYIERSAPDAVKRCLSLVPRGSVVGWGGSMSCMDSGLIDAVKKSFTVLDRDSAKNGEERNAIMRRILAEADVFLTSFNAVSEDGLAVNIDGNGNRVSAVAFGPGIVIALVGRNKITASLEDAYKRASTVAAGKNAVRFGKSYDDGPSLCNIVEILRSGGNGRIKVVLVDEELGF